MGDILSSYLDSIPEVKPKAEQSVDHPAHYGGADNTYEAIKVNVS